MNDTVDDAGINVDRGVKSYSGCTTALELVPVGK